MKPTAMEQHDETNEIIARYPGMQLVPVWMYENEMMRRSVRSLSFWMLMFVIVIVVGLLKVIVGWPALGNGVLIGVLLAVYAMVVVLSLRAVGVQRQLTRKCARLKGKATHVEYYCHRGRRMRRVYADGRLGLVTDRSFRVMLPLEYSSIVWVFKGKYKVLHRPDEPYEVVEEEDLLRPATTWPWPPLHPLKSGHC